MQFRLGMKNQRARQQSFFPPTTKEHGGILAVGKRRSRRPLSTKHALHVTLKSDHASGLRSLLRHRQLIERISERAAKRFGIRIYQHAICNNHLHFLIRGKRREEIQNFFRVFAGHIAQEILRAHPLPTPEPASKPGAPPPAHRPGCKKNQRKFWALLIYSRVTSWGREFKSVSLYIIRNTLEALHIIAYRPRRAAKVRDCGKGRAEFAEEDARPQAK